MTIKELNTKAVFRSFNVSKDVNGDLVQTVLAEWEKWVKIEQNNGNLLISSGLEGFSESYKITCRYEKTRPTKADYEIEYKGKLMKIYNVKIEQEGLAWWEIINAYTSN